MNAPTNLINQIEFSIILENYISEDEMARINAVNFIECCRKQNVFNFLKNLLNVIKNKESSQLSKKIALILSSKTFELISSPNQFISSYQYIEESAPGLIENFLYESVSLFAFIPFFSGHLFSSVAIIICEYNESTNIIQNFCNSLMQTTDLNFIEGALIALNDISQELALFPNQYFPILRIIFQYISNSNIPDKIKILSMSILKFLICIIDDAFEDQATAISILKCIEISIVLPFTKSVSYYCLWQIIKHQFPIFLLVAEKILPITSFDLNEASQSMNEDIITPICLMLQILAVTENEINCTTPNINEYDAKRIQILTNIIPTFFPILLKISCSNTSPIPDSPEESDCSTLAFQTIARIFEIVPNASFTQISEFSKANLFLPQNNPSIREISCNFISLTITFCNTTQIQQFLSSFFNQNQQKIPISQILIQLVSQILNDSFLRVKNAALSLLLSIISSDLEIDHSFILYFIPKMMEIINSESLISAKACDNLQSLLELSRDRNEYSDINLPSMLLALLNHTGNSNNYFIFSLFNCINLIIKMLDIQQIQSAIPILLNIIFQSFEDQRLNKNEDEFLYMFKVLCESTQYKSIQSQIDYTQFFTPFLDQLFHLFIEKFMITENRNLLISLAYLGSVTLQYYMPFLPTFYELIVKNTSSFLISHQSQKIEDFVSLTKLLSESFDLHPFINVLSDLALKIMKECISDNFNDLESFSYLMNLFSMLIRKYFDVVSEKVIVLIQLITPIISKSPNIENIELQSLFLVEASVVITNIFEKIDKNAAVGFLEIAMALSQNIVSLIHISETNISEKKSKQLEKIINFFNQIANVNAELFRVFLRSNEKCIKFFYYLLKHENLFDKTSNFLITIGIGIDELK